MIFQLPHASTDPRPKPQVASHRVGAPNRGKSRPVKLVFDIGDSRHAFSKRGKDIRSKGLGLDVHASSTDVTAASFKTSASGHLLPRAPALLHSHSHPRVSAATRSSRGSGPAARPTPRRLRPCCSQTVPRLRPCCMATEIPRLRPCRTFLQPGHTSMRSRSRGTRSFQPLGTQMLHSIEHQWTFRQYTTIARWH